MSSQSNEKAFLAYNLYEKGFCLGIYYQEYKITSMASLLLNQVIYNIKNVK